MPNNFTYILGVPNPPNAPATDVPNMQTNTNSIPSLINIDHVGFNTNGSGIHKQVTLANESAPGLGDGNGVLFANLANSNSWPFWQNASGTFALFGQNSAGANGYTTIPGGFIVQWGVINGSHGGNNHFNGGDGGTVTFAISNIAFSNNCFGVQIIPLYNTNTGSAPSGVGNVSYDLFTLSKTKFDWTFNSNSSQYVQFFWLAIGN